MKPALALLALGVLALTGCAGAAPVAESTAPSAPDECAEVTVVVDFGPLDTPSIDACVAAGQAVDVLDDAGVVTEGTADYGDQVVCRVNGAPSPESESCTTLPTGAYWALWVRQAPGSEWEYAQEGVATLQLTAGQSVGLVYTEGTDSVPPPG